jgi:hypothetical protein
MYPMWHVIYNLRAKEAIQHFVDLSASLFFPASNFSLVIYPISGYMSTRSIQRATPPDF